MAFEWTVPPSKAFGEMYTAYERKIYYAVLTLLRRRAPEVQNWMRENRRWTDRTGNARASLTAEVVADPEQITLLLTFGRLRHSRTVQKVSKKVSVPVLAGTILEYARYLEFAHGGRYAILGPALDYWKPIIIQDIKTLLR